jgi:predicted acyl esterase
VFGEAPWSPAQATGQARPQTPASAARAAAGAYFATQADREDMIRIPVRDGIHLSATLVFPKNKPRQNLPTILVLFPYLINPVSAEN